MKKIMLTIAALAMTAVVSGAASFTWGTGFTSSSQVLWEGTQISDGSVTGYLVYLGKTEDSFYTIKENEVLDPIMTSAPSQVKPPQFAGRLNYVFESKMADTMPGTSDSLANGSVFGMYITWTDDDGTEWINVASNTYTLSGLEDDSSMIKDAVFTFNYDKSSDNTLTAGGGWVAVPEPATAALALAGVAMLFRRRK